MNRNIRSGCNTKSDFLEGVGVRERKMPAFTVYRICSESAVDLIHYRHVELRLLEHYFYFLRELNTLDTFSAIFTREMTFITSCLPSCTPGPY